MLHAASRAALTLDLQKLGQPSRATDGLAAEEEKVTYRSIMEGFVAESFKKDKYWKSALGSGLLHRKKTAIRSLRAHNRKFNDMVKPWGATDKPPAVARRYGGGDSAITGNVHATDLRHQDAVEMFTDFNSTRSWR